MPGKASAAPGAEPPARGETTKAGPPLGAEAVPSAGAARGRDASGKAGPPSAAEPASMAARSGKPAEAKSGSADAKPAEPARAASSAEPAASGAEPAGKPAVGDDAGQQEGRVTVVPGVPRYHDENCILIRFMGDDDLQRMSLGAATAAGCTPCRACQPDD